MTVRIDESLEGIDWAQAKADLAADHPFIVRVNTFH